MSWILITFEMKKPALRVTVMGMAWHDITKEKPSLVDQIDCPVQLVKVWAVEPG